MLRKAAEALMLLFVLWPLAVFAQEEDGWDFVPGEELLLFDDYTDMPKGAAPPHWKVRGAAVRLVDGRLAVGAGSATRMTPNIAKWPDNFTIEMNIQGGPSAEDSLRNVTWVFERGDSWIWQVTLALYAGGTCKAIVEIADPGENQIVDCSWMREGQNDFALYQPNRASTT